MEELESEEIYEDKTVDFTCSDCCGVDLDDCGQFNCKNYKTRY